MDRLEQQLRTTLADDRLELPLRPDAARLVQAGVRLRRRNRAIATVTSAVVLLGGGLAAASLVTSHGGIDRIVPPTGGGQPSGKPSLPTPTHVEVAWDAVPYDYHHPPAFSGAIPDTTVEWCRASQLTLLQSFQGAGGSWVGTVTVTNNSNKTCALQGQPTVSMVDTSGHALLTSHPEPFFVDAWIQLTAGHSAGAEVTWSPEFCHAPTVGRISVALPHLGGSLSTAMQGSPRCDVDTVTPMVGHLDVGGFVADQNQPFTPMAGLQAQLDKVPATALPGSLLTYRLQLQSAATPSVLLDTCLPYRARLVNDTTHVVLYEEDFLLNGCGSPPITVTDAQSQHSTFFDLRFDVPASAPPGDYDLVWQSVLKPVNAASGSVVHIQDAPPPCRDGQIAISAGSTGAGLGSYYDTIVFRNVSSSICSLYGYPGVQLADGSGHGVRTNEQRDPMTAHVVVLAPGRTASATISGADSGPNGGATPCKPSAGVLVIAPGQRRQTLVRHLGARCFDNVSIWPVVAGSKGSLNSSP